MSKAKFVRIGVGVFAQDQEGRLLLERRKDSGTWCLPGGMIEVGESVREAALRECREETGLDIEIQELIGVYSEPPLERTVTYPDTGKAQLIDIIFRGKIVSGKLVCSSESEAVSFFGEKELPEIFPRSRNPIEDGFQNRKGMIR